MNIAFLLAAGIGSRINSINKPKQFIEISEKPIFIHTIEKFINSNVIDLIILIYNKDFKNETINYLDKFNLIDNVVMCSGGKTRNDSIINAINLVKEFKIVSAEDTILTHDAARMFVSKNIIEENIKYCVEKVCVNTVIPTEDTIIISEDGKFSTSTINRNYCYNVQTPQTFKFDVLNDIYSGNVKLTTDACTLAQEKGYSIKLVNGSKDNFKITTDVDILTANSILKLNK
ncbi:MAG: IspD/TarI family cytidylyltransferase [Mycoplasma sp.]